MIPLSYQIICFYLVPYVFMAFYKLSDRLPRKINHIILLSIISAYLYILISTTYVLVTQGFRFQRLSIVFGWTPTYLSLFYLASWTLTAFSFIMQVKDISILKAVSAGFLISYLNSFYWELPENIYWQIKRGYHPAIIFVVLGAFTYVFLNNELGWEKKRENYLLIGLGWLSTTIGVLIFPSGLQTIGLGLFYFLLCRLFCHWILTILFVWKSIDAFKRSTTWRLSQFGAITMCYLWGLWMIITNQPIKMGYWDKRYSKGGTSGLGSTNELAKWKWNIIYQYIPKIDRVIDFGCGDLSFWNHKFCEDYVGVDTSKTIIRKNRKRYPNKTFIRYQPDSVMSFPQRPIVLCMDVLFHIMNDVEFINTLKSLCRCSTNHIIISTWMNNPMYPRITDGKYQHYRPLLDYDSIFKNAGFQLIGTHDYSDEINAIYIFKKVNE